MLASVFGHPVFHLVHLVALFREVPDVLVVDVVLRLDQLEDILVEAFLSRSFIVGAQRKFEIAVVVRRKLHPDVEDAAGGVFSHDDALAVGSSIFVGSG